MDDDEPDDDPAGRRFTGLDGPEVALPKGDVTEGVVRVGATVRRPHQPQSLAVAAYLDHLHRTGFGAAPRYLGRDAQGRDVLDFLDGDVAGDPPSAAFAGDDLLASVAVLLRRLHDASAGFRAAEEFAAPPGTVWGRDLVAVDTGVPDPVWELVSHTDVTPQNVVVWDGSAAGFVDFDLAGPTTRLLDAWNTAMWWVPLRPPGDVGPDWADLDRPYRLRVFADAYGLDRAQRAALVPLGIERADVTWLRMRASAQTLGDGWARMWREGAGDAVRRRQAWLRAERATLERGLSG